MKLVRWEELRRISVLLFHLFFLYSAHIQVFFRHFIDNARRSGWYLLWVLVGAWYRINLQFIEAYLWFSFLIFVRLFGRLDLSWWLLAWYNRRNRTLFHFLVLLWLLNHLWLLDILFWNCLFRYLLFLKPLPKIVIIIFLFFFWLLIFLKLIVDSNNRWLLFLEERFLLIYSRRLLCVIVCICCCVSSCAQFGRLDVRVLEEKHFIRL